MLTPREIQSLHKKGKNIIQTLREEYSHQFNSAEAIDISYDLQAGSYIELMQNPEEEEYRKYKHAYTAELAGVVGALCQPESILEAGVGEATTLSGVLKNSAPKIKSFGFDLSWSRVAYANRWLQGERIGTTTLCMGNMFDIPFADNSIDVVYTSHSIEPNGGNEIPILKELYRVAKKFLILLEPGYEFASSDAKQRMDCHGYCKNLKGYSEELGYKVLDHKLFKLSINPLNPTAITIIEKNNKDASLSDPLVCPKFKTPLKRIGGMFFSPEALRVYPIVGGIPCLRVEDGVFASHFEEFFGEI